MSLALIFAESDSNSDGSDSGGSESGEGGSGDEASGSGADSAFVASSGPADARGGSSDGSGNASSDYGAGDDQTHSRRKPGEPGVTGTLNDRDLTDIPLSDDSPIKK